MVKSKIFQQGKAKKLRHSGKVQWQGQDGIVTIARLADGIPIIKAKTQRDAMYAQGWLHAQDRQMQLFLTRSIMQGRASEQLSTDASLIELDSYVRRMQFFPDATQEVKKLNLQAHEFLKQYSLGINDFIAKHGYIWELKLLQRKWQSWQPVDSLLLAKAFTYIGLASGQADIQRFILQLVQNNLDEERLRELFPYLTDNFDVDVIKKINLTETLLPSFILEKIPKFTASNNWVLQKKSQTIFCGDPHLEINRLPAIWYEQCLVWEGQELVGVSMPGSPVILLGRNRHVAWSPTYSYMDMLDHRIEECQGGKYRRQKGRTNHWFAFEKKVEVLRFKKAIRKNGKKIKQIEIPVYYNELGVLEGNPHEDGFYLINNWSTRYQAVANDINAFFDLQNAQNTKEAMACFRKMDVLTYNWLIADSQENIGYQMSGRTFKRPSSISGLMAHPAWLKKFDTKGFLNPMNLPRLYNPKTKMMATANNDLNHLAKGKSLPINAAMASYRTDRILFLLHKSKNADFISMKKIHYDLYSIQAEKFMKLIRPHLPASKEGNLLKKWNLEYSEDSIEASIFETIYFALIKNLFGDHGFGREAMEFLWNETSLFNNYFGNLDAIFFNKNSVWFKKTKREQVIKKAIAEALPSTNPPYSTNIKFLPYGKNQKVTFRNLMFGNILPQWLGFDKGSFSLAGSRATVQQRQILKFSGRTIVFAPSFRFITDMKTGEMYFNSPAGISDRRFSKLYFNRYADWANGKYTKININDLAKLKI